MAIPTLREGALQGFGVTFDILAAFADKLPFPAAAIFTLAKDIIVNVEAVEANQEECTALEEHTRQLLTVVLATMKAKADNLQEHFIPAQIEQNVERFHKTLEKIAKTTAKIRAVVHSKRKRDKIRAFVSSKWYASELKQCTNDLNWAMELFKVTDQLENSSRICHVSHLIEGVGDQVEDVAADVKVIEVKVEGVSGQIGNVHTNLVLESLPRAKRASSTCARPDRPEGCFQGTRTAILDLIFDWMVNADFKIPKCFWLKGLAGIGKTTVAYSIAKLARSHGLLAVDFFFSRLGDKDLRDPALVFPTIAYQLALVDPEFSRVITAALERHPDAGYSSLKNQLDRLIIEPLSKAKTDPKRIVVLVLDAFDECEAKGAKEILQLLVAALPFLPFFLKIFITSRPEEHIRSVLIPSNNLHITALHDIEDSVVREDIELYLRARLKSLPADLGRGDLGEDWITEGEIKLLADAAGNFFIHAATGLRFLMGRLGPRKQLRFLLKFIQSPGQSLSINPLISLDRLYLQVLLGILDETTGAEVAQLFQTVVGSIVLLRDPLPVRALEQLTALDDNDATELLNNLHSVILPPGPPDDCPRIYHPSFPDFLLDHARCPDDKLWIDAKVHEPRLALRCLEIMNQLLHKDMLGKFDSCWLNIEVHNLVDRVAAAIPPELQYACRFWAFHLARVSHPADKRILDSLAVFASRALLPWLEAVSWMGQTHSAVQVLEIANAWAAMSSCSPLTASLLNDAHRLLLAHFPTITESALHIARSVLPFSPQHIQLTSTYLYYADSNIKVINGADLEWSSCLMILKGHNDRVSSVAVSTDGARIVSGSYDKTLHVWSANNGESIAMLEGHTGGIRSVAFSPDGDRVVSGSSDQTVRLWDVTTGREVFKLEGHKNAISSVSFSPDGVRIASGSLDRTIRIWDAVTGGVLFILKGHSNWVQSVMFFPDGRRLVSGSYDCTVHVWDLADETCVARLEGHSHFVLAVAISPDGLQIASGSQDNTLRIWDVSSRECIGILRGRTHPVRAVAFSPNGSQIATGSDDKSVRLWNAITYQKIAVYNGHGDGITSVVFSHDGRYIVSGSGDQSVKIWDARAVQGEKAGSTNPEGVVSLALSSDRSRLAVLTWGSKDMTVHVRDFKKPLWPIIFSFTTGWSVSDWGLRMRFSPGDTRIVVKSCDRTAIYSAFNGHCLADSDIPDSNLPLFTFQDGKVLRRGVASSTLCCFLPPSLQANDIAAFEVDGELGHRILVGCRDGRILTLHIA